MDIEVAQLLSQPITLPPLKLPVVIYGAGNTGAAVCSYLTSAGYRVAGLLDANARPEQHWRGIPVYRPQGWLERNRPAEFEVVVAIHNYAVDMGPLLEEIRKMGFARVINMVEYQNLFTDDQPFRYWLTPGTFYQPFLLEIDQLLALLADEMSRVWLKAVLAFRLTGDYSRLPSPTPRDQYRPDGLPRWSNPMRFIDCGAFNGDTIEQFARRDGYRFDAIAAFEPDPGNFAALTARASTHGPSACFPCGVGASTSLVRFQTGQGMGSRSSPEGDSAIQCVAIDQALGNFRPTLIKMDIEGAELEALWGARNTIMASRPGLAISLYHQPAHLWQIPLLISSWSLGYRLYIRGHAHNGFELVFYAIPESMFE
jgi:FkbM family methyltransferase